MYAFSPAGTIVCVCEPQAVWIMSMNIGRCGVRNIEDTDPFIAHAPAVHDRRVRARAVLRGLAAVNRLEQEALAAHLVDRDVVLRPAALVVHHHLRLRAADVEDAETVVVAGIRQVAPEGEVRVDGAVLVGVADQRHARGPGCGRSGIRLQLGVVAHEAPHEAFPVHPVHPGHVHLPLLSGCATACPTTANDIAAAKSNANLRIRGTLPVVGRTAPARHSRPFPGPGYA